MDEQNEATITDLNHKNDLKLEINFSDNEDLSRCVRIKMGDKQAIVSMDELHAFVFAVATEEQKLDLVPVRQVKVEKIMKWHLVEAKTDIRKGEKIKVRCETNVPVEMFNGIVGGLKKWQDRTKSSILVPK